MASFDFAGLGGAVSDSEACGPDLDLAGDADYMNFVARAEGLLPTTFFSGPDGRPFDRASIDFAAEFATIGPIIERTRDLRLLTLLAKFLVLNRDLAGFIGCVGLLDKLLRERWDEVHPQATDGDFAVRTAAVESLDDMPPVVFPLQYLPLINHRRLGPVSYRSWMIATGEAKSREGEEMHDAATIEVAFMEEELPVLIARREQFQTLRSTLASIRGIYVDRLGADRAAKLERLPALAEKIYALLESVVAKRDPSLASAPPGGLQPEAAGGPPSSIPAGAVTTNRDVIDALAAIAEYFARAEPSNPALLLVRQAEQLMGKSFVDVMRVLVPNHMEQAAVRIGKDQMFDLPIERLSEFATVAPSSQDPSKEAPPEGALPDSERTSDFPEVQPSASPAARRIEVRTRGDATRLLDQIGSFYRVAEPSSPVPFLTDRARSFAERDFLSLLKEFLPPDSLKGPTPGA